MKRFIAAALAFSMIAAPALAQPNQPAGNPPQQGQDHKSHPGQPAPQQQPQKSQAPAHRYSYEGRQYDAVRGPSWTAPKGHRANVVWDRGDRLPSIYRDRAYVIDYHAYRLRKPPRGYVWVRIDRNVYLVAQKNGLISQVVIGLFY